MALDPLKCIQELPVGTLILMQKMPDGLWHGDLHHDGRREYGQSDFLQGLVNKLAVKWKRGKKVKT